MWGSNAIRLSNRPSPSHRFNHAVVGAGCTYRNVALLHRQVVIQLNAGVYWRKGSGPLLKWASQPIKCLVDTGATTSIFNAQIAVDLGLSIEKPFLKKITLADDSEVSYWWSEHELALSIGPGFLGVRVRFPVEKTPTGYVWKHGFPNPSLLGMKDVWEHRMLCVTPERLFVFCRT